MLKKWSVIFFVLSLSTPIPSLAQNSVERTQSICPDMSNDGAVNPPSNDAFTDVLDAICGVVKNKIVDTTNAENTKNVAKDDADGAEKDRQDAVNDRQDASNNAMDKQTIANSRQEEVNVAKDKFDNLISDNREYANYFDFDTTTSASDPKIELTQVGQNYLNSFMDIQGIIITELPAKLSQLIGIQEDHNAKVDVADGAEKDRQDAVNDLHEKTTTETTKTTEATEANKALDVATVALDVATAARDVATAAVDVKGLVGGPYIDSKNASFDAATAATIATAATAAIGTNDLKVVMAEKDSPGVLDALKTINTVLKNKDIKVAETKAADALTRAGTAKTKVKNFTEAVSNSEIFDIDTQKLTKLTKQEEKNAADAKMNFDTVADAAVNIPQPKLIKQEAFLEYLVFLEYLNSLQTNTNDIPVEEITNLIADEKSSDSENIRQVNSTQLSSVSSRLSSLRHGLVSLSYNNNDRLSHPLPSLASTAGVTQAFKKVQFNHRTTELSRERGGAAGDDELPSGNSRWGVYVTGMYGRGDKDVPNKSSEGFEFDAKNFTIGADYLLDVSTIVGLAMGYGSAGINYSNDRGSFDIDTNTVSVYGSRYINNSWFLDGVIGLGSSHYTSSRAIRYSVKDGDSVKEKTQTTKAAPKGDQLLLSLGASKTITITTKSTIDWDFSARVNYLEAKINGYTETSDVPEMGTGFVSRDRRPDH